MSWQVRTLPDRYADSVRLMGIARALRDHEGVSACEVVMGTPANLSALAALGASAEAGPSDVVVAVDGEDGLGDTVLAEVQRLLVGGAAQSDAGPAPARTLAAIDAAQHRPHLGAGRVRDARGPSRTDTRACTSSSSQTTCRSRTRSRSSAAAPRTGSW